MNCIEYIMQGDQYAIPFHISYISDSSEKIDITPELIDKIEICIGPIIKTTPAITYDSAKSIWYFPITQEETFSMSSKSVKSQIRVYFKTGDVIGKDLGYIVIRESMSKEIFE